MLSSTHIYIYIHTHRLYYRATLFTYKLRGMSGINPALKFKRVELKQWQTGRGERRLEEFNEHPQREREGDFLQASRPARREQHREIISKAVEIRGDLQPD